MEQREKVIECADGIIDYIVEQMIMERVKEDFGKSSIEIADAVYEQIKLRM